VKEFVLDASFALRWCFEDEATPVTDELLEDLENQAARAWVPGIWQYEMLNGLGKGIVRGRLDRSNALVFWRDIHALPFRVVNVSVDEKLLELSLKHNLAVYDACYLSLTQTRQIPMATADGKLQQATESIGFEVIKP
jgi:predicted nucleic acid-binding protein